MYKTNEATSTQALYMTVEFICVVDLSKGKY